eukprot:gene9024-11054_t
MPCSHSFEPYTYKVPLEFYMEVYYRRFPTHKLFPYILDSEIIDHKHLDNGVEVVVRKVKLDVDAPEEAMIDKPNRKVVIKTTNETLSSKAKMDDITVYQVHPENPDWCTFTQTGTVELLVSIFGFQKKIEKYVLDLYTSRYNESRELDLKMIEEYKNELEEKKKNQDNTNTNNNNTHHQDNPSTTTTTNSSSSSSSSTTTNTTNSSENSNENKNSVDTTTNNNHPGTSVSVEKEEIHISS